jgi:hypothetical protein
MVSYFDTPILFLIFNRPDVTQKVFDQFKIIKPRYLFVAADGPRPNNDRDQIFCKETRNIINQIDWDCELKTLFREENLGCGYAVCSAIDWFFGQVEEGIILEDDCLPDVSFFPFCKELLIKYKEDDSVYLISGTNMQNGKKRGDNSYYFSHYPITWGWATWRRAWTHFDHNISNLDELFKSDELKHVFQSSQEKKFWECKLSESSQNKKSVWDFQWWYAIWKNKGIAIIPNVNLIVNLGFRATGSHYFLKDSIREPIFSGSIVFPLKHPIEMVVNKDADRFTYKNAYSHSFTRLFRLAKENGIFTFIKYMLCRQ